MTDIELLIPAAKAMGIAHVDYTDNSYDGRLGLERVDSVGRHIGSWSPLTDDGDALRILVELRLNLTLTYLPHAGYVAIYNSHVSIMESVEDSRVEKIDRPAAIRRAIVRAAAELGKTIKEKS